MRSRIARPMGRRTFNALAGSTVLAGAGARGALAQAKPVKGGTITVAQLVEASILSSAFDTATQVQVISSKMIEGLISYEHDFKPIPRLATAWTVSPDGLRISFTLRQGVQWHDGKPFTSKDVAFSVLEVWKKLHGRGRLTYANVTAVETPDPHTAILVLSKPSPYIMNALAAMESGVLPAHIYEGTDIRANPANLAPVGTGPFKFKSWARGQNVVLERNPNYWDPGKPYLDQIIFQLIPDAGARGAAIEAGRADLSYQSSVPLSDAKRLDALPNVEVTDKGYAYQSTQMMMEFNFDNRYLKDLKVRQAIAHAIDPAFPTSVVWFDYGLPATGPIHQNLVKFYTADVPKYEPNVATANKMLDQAGYKRGADGVRFRLNIDPLAFGDTYLRTAEYIKQQLGDIGIALAIRNQDFAAYVRRVYTDYDFDLTVVGVTQSADPTIGIQRFYLSTNYVKGAPFSNAGHYNNPEVDRLLIAGQSEMDPAKRKAIFADFQRVAMGDLPVLPLTSINQITVTNARLKDHTLTADGVFDSLASAWLSPK
jgi:peptide/nickel transport system substrate-binding protein